jgi:hypothetical protein
VAYYPLGTISLTRIAQTRLSPSSTPSEELDRRTLLNRLWALPELVTLTEATIDEEPVPEISGARPAQTRCLRPVTTRTSRATNSNATVNDAVARTTHDRTGGYRTVSRSCPSERR